MLTRCDRRRWPPIGEDLADRDARRVSSARIRIRQITLELHACFVRSRALAEGDAVEGTRVIGRCEAGPPGVFLTREGARIAVPAEGFDHFA